jgi:hypothetical protein
MLDSVSSLKGYQMGGLDGVIGSVKEFFFDDQYWTVRYLVANTGNWLTTRQVLIAPYALGAVDRDERHLTVRLTKKQIEDSPPLSSDQPVSRQFELAYYGYYGWPRYWSGSFMWGASPSIVRDPEQWRSATPGDSAWDPTLRSTKDVTGHHLQALDGEIGHVDDFIIDDGVWAIRYLVVDTRNWWPGKKVLVSPQWIDRVSWTEGKVFVNLSRDAVKQAPEYTEETALTREYETALHRHYGRHGYWADEPAPVTPMVW